jgi:hypothetical protein
MAKCPFKNEECLKNNCEAYEIPEIENGEQVGDYCKIIEGINSLISLTDMITELIQSAISKNPFTKLRG